MKWLARFVVFVVSFFLGMVAYSVATSGCANEAQFAEVSVAPVELPSEIETKSQDVSVCDLKTDPAKFNHVVVKVSGYFSRGFEDSTLYDPTCKNNQWIWVDMGGKRSIGVMYCCGFTPTRERQEELEIENVKLPITEDTYFNKYDKLLAEGKNVKATVIGTFFSGEKTQYSDDAPVFYGGYGHMGIGSLFIVQQVLSVEVTKIENKLY